MSKVTFNKNSNLFQQSVKRSVDAYFNSKQIKKTGNWKLYSKAVILIPLALAEYSFLLFGQYSPFIGVVLSIILGLTLVSIAFNVMHDACHGSFSSKKWVNELMGYTMNALGSNAYIWKIKHNIIHHTYTNIDGIDDDIAKAPFLRHCPTQKWVPAHKYQFLYMFFLYSISTILWVWVSDFVKYFSKKVVVTSMKLSTREHVIFWASKVLYALFYVALPVLFVGWGPWAIGYVIMNATIGLTLSIVFQLAHVVEKTAFEEVGEEPKMLDAEWAAHQVMTTSDFAPKNKVVSWFVGGLNFQVEHHLFPRVSHVHYPAISKIVQEECAKFDLPYHYYPRMRQAIFSHVRVMKNLGKKDFFQNAN
jgi:linoleoyl-CoA desaturase